MYSSEFRDIDLTTRNESHNFSNIPATKPTLSPLLDGTKMIDAQDTELSHEAVTTADDGSNPNAIEYERISWGHPVEDTLNALIFAGLKFREFREGQFFGYFAGIKFREFRE